MLSIDIHKELHGSQGDMILDVKLDIKRGEFIALMGESGSGKTTLLRVLAGLEKAKGDIRVEGVVWLSKKSILPPQQRKIGFVFQDYALFENMTVKQNLLFVNNDKKLASKLLEMTELAGLSSRNVQTLSGGQKQRVSLCRAMMKKPKLLLMDEPLSALHPNMRSKLQKEIKQLHLLFGTTTIMVSHDPSEVFALANRVWILEQGKIIKNSLVSKIFKTEKKEHRVKVLWLSTLLDKKIATVWIAGSFFEIEVPQTTKVGDYIKTILNLQLKK